MTHHTDAERAACPVCGGKPFIRRSHDADGMRWSHVECKSCGLRTRGKWAASSSDECPIFFQEVWEEWPRRAPAAPVPLRKPTIDEVAEAVGYHASAWDCVGPRELIDAILMLAAAPQPPEAAPVQLPEPAIPGSQGVCCGNFTTGGYYMGQHEQVCCGCPDDAHPPYYTEQQVRELLATAPSAVSNGSWPYAPPQENIRKGMPYSDPVFEKLAREHAVWGTAQSALCAQFWLAALAQRVPLTDAEIEALLTTWPDDSIAFFDFARAIERAHGIGKDKA